MSDLTEQDAAELTEFAALRAAVDDENDLFDMVAGIVTRHRADLRESIAADIEGHHGEDCACGCPDPNPDNVPIALLETCRRTRDAAARIARGGER